MNVRRMVWLRWTSYLVLLLVLLLALSACERQLQGLLENNGGTQTAEEQAQPGPDEEAEVEGDAEMAPGLDAATAEPAAAETEEGDAAAGAEEPAAGDDQPVTGIPSDDPEGATAVAEAAATEESPRPAEAATPESEAEATDEATVTPEETAEEQPPAAQEATEEATAEATEEATAEAASEEATAEATAAATKAAAGETTETEQAGAADEERIHVVQAGENLYRIGLQYGISWAVLAEYNSLPNANAITVGQELRIPAEPATGGTPTATPMPPPTATTYVVQPGDTLARIARSFDLTWQEIAAANGLVNPSLIYVGQELKIPGSAPAPQLTHTVQPRETLFLIALQYGVPWTSIASANKLAAPYVIYPGQTLVIPGDSP